MRIRKERLPVGGLSILSHRAPLGKLAFGQVTAKLPLDQRLALAARCEVEFHLVDDQVHRDGVIQRDFDGGAVNGYLDLFSLHGNVQIFDGLEDFVANLILRIAIDHAETRKFLHLVGELIVGDVGRQYFDGSEYSRHQDGRVDKSFELAFATLAAQSRSSPATPIVAFEHKSLPESSVWHQPHQLEAAQSTDRKT